jgi:hypothetical protein
MTWALMALVLAGGAAVATTAASGAAIVNAPDPSKVFNTGDLVFVRPPLDSAEPLDAAILATGNATVQWLKGHGVSDICPTLSHAALHIDH